MARYCSWCGAELEPSARYCGECGARILESVKVDGKGVDPMRGLDVVRGNPIPASKTSELDADARAAIELSDDLPAAEHPADDLPVEEPSSGSGKQEKASAETSAAQQNVKEVAVAVPRDADKKSTSGPMSFDGTDTLVLPSDAEPKRYSLERPDLEARKRKRMLIALICVIVALAVAAGVLAYMRFGGASQTENQPAQTQKQETQSSSQQNSEKQDSDNAATADASQSQQNQQSVAKESETASEDEIYETLSSAYAALDGYSDRIVACVDEFNGLYMSKVLSERTAAQATADKVKSDLAATRAEIDALKVSSSSAYYQDAQNVAELYDCQIGRIGSICDAWAVSVSYEVPYQHKDEILAALSKDYESGRNVYLDRYDELYPTSKPTKK